jgi:hypothetical protein
MSRRKRVFLLSLPVALVLLGLAVFRLWPRTTVITPESFAHLRVGMPRAEVEGILGGPPRDESSGPSQMDLSALATDEEKLRVINEVRAMVILGPEYWISDRIAIWAVFDDAGRLHKVASFPVRRAEETLLQTFGRLVLF